ncbi:MAG: hypothetical protein AB1650_01210 [Candidatus Omnitrophota bacterium]
MNKSLFFIFFFLLSLSPLKAATIPSEAVDISNQIILDIYQEILDQKTFFPELSEFGERHLFKNQHGIYVIFYETNDQRIKNPFSMGVTINAMEDNQFPGKRGQFNYGFPKINLKISGFQRERSLRTQFDLSPIVIKQGMKLAEYQQTFLPLRVEVRPLKKTFQVGEEITIDVVLKNVSKRHMIVKSLGNETLFFLMNNEAWGTSPAIARARGSNEILKSGEETMIRLKGKGFENPEKLEITCFYNMSIEGIHPIGRSFIEVQE